MPSKNKTTRERTPKSINAPKQMKKPKLSLEHLLKAIYTISNEHEKERTKREKLESYLEVKNRDIEDVYKINGEIRNAIKEAIGYLEDMPLNDTSMVKVLRILKEHLPITLSEPKDNGKK